MSTSSEKGYFGLSNEQLKCKAIQFTITQNKAKFGLFFLKNYLNDRAAEFVSINAYVYFVVSQITLDSDQPTQNKELLPKKKRGLFLSPLCNLSL